MDLYRPSRGSDGNQARVDALIERCLEAGVELSHRPPSPTPWRTVIAQLASDADLAAFAILASDYTANSGWIDLEMPRQVEQHGVGGQADDLKDTTPAP